MGSDSVGTFFVAIHEVVKIYSFVELKNIINFDSHILSLIICVSFDWKNKNIWTVWDPSWTVSILDNRPIFYRLGLFKAFYYALVVLFQGLIQSLFVKLKDNYTHFFFSLGQYFFLSIFILHVVDNYHGSLEIFFDRISKVFGLYAIFLLVFHFNLIFKFIDIKSTFINHGTLPCRVELCWVQITV